MALRREPSPLSSVCKMSRTQAPPPLPSTFEKGVLFWLLGL